jgi:phenylacetate degradation-related enoyl-CoA hydratase PaaB
MNGEALVFTRIHAGYRVITLNRPEKLNAFNEPMHEALRKALEESEADETCRALMLTGAGRAFCTGQDLADRLLKPGEKPVPRNSLEQYYNPLIRKLRALPFPVIAAVNGVAAGAGCNIALACDIVLAARSANFVQSFARVGLIPDSGGTWFLPRLVGTARARGLALLAEPLSAENAEQWGLIWKCVDDSELASEAQKLCEHFSGAPTLGLALIKKALNASLDNTLDAQLDLERDLQRAASLTSDYAEGVRAFMEKRKANFTSRKARPDKRPLRVGLAGLGAVGMEVARRLIAGIPGLQLTAVAVRDVEKARRALPQIGSSIQLRKATELADDCDVVVECLPPALFRDVAVSVIDKGRIFMPLSVAQLLENDDLIERARQKTARILVPTGALIGLDAVRAAAEGTIHSVTMVTRKPPAGLEGAPYLRERRISVADLKDALKVFEGSAREGARGFPTNVNVAAALSLAGIGPDRTRLEIWADPNVTRNTHTITVDADTARFTMTIENIPSENPRTGKSVAPSTVAALRALVSELKVGT